MEEIESRWSRILCGAVFVGLLVCAGSPVSAQSTDATTETAAGASVEEAPPASEVIPLSELAPAAEKIGVEIAELRSLVKTSEAVTRSVAGLQDLETTISALEQEPGFVKPESVTWSALDSILRQWRRLAAKLNEVDKLIAQRSRVLEGRAAGIVHAQELWTRTRGVLVEQETPEPVIERIDAVLQDLAEIQVAMKERQAELFTLQDRITSDQIRAKQAMDRLADLSADARRKIFATTDPPIWRALSKGQDDEEGPALYEQWRNSWQRAKSDLSGFRKDFKEELILHAVFTVILMIVLGRLGRRAKGWAKTEEDLKAVAAVLSRPMAAGYVVAVTGTIVLYPDAPSAVYKLAYISSTLPMFLLLRAIVSTEWRRALYGPVGLFALLHLGSLVPGLHLFQRLLYLALTLAAGVGTGLLLLRFRAEKLRAAGAWWRLVIVSCRIAVLMLGLSFLGNIFGYFELTLILTGGVFNSAYMALATVVSVLILDGAVAVAMETETARKLRMIRFHPRPIRRRVSRSIHLGGALLWTWVTLMMFDLSSMIMGWIKVALGKQWTIGTLEASLGAVLAFVFTIWVSILISRFVLFVLEEDVYPRVRVARGLPGTISMLVRYSLLAVGFLIAVAAAGIPLSNFAILAGALGVGIGFGMQNIVNNFISGLILAFERPIQIGDTVEVGEFLGEVRKIGIRASNVRTFDGAEVIVPNGDLISAQVINWTLSDRRRRIRLPVGVAYGTDPQRVIDLLKKVAEDHEDVQGQPEPNVLFNGFGDSSLDFEMRFWTPAYDRYLGVRSEVAVQVHAALKEAGIEIPFPQRDLHVRSVDRRAARSMAGNPVVEVEVPEQPAAPPEDPSVVPGESR